MEEAKHQRARIDALRSFWESREFEGGVVKRETGIRGFDELLEGGLPEQRVTLISGGPGCGKTVMLAEFIYRGITFYDEPGIFLTFEERPADVIRNLRNFGWHVDDIVNNGQLTFIDATLPDGDEEVSAPVDWLEPMIARIQQAVKDTGATRLVIDNLGAVFLRYQNDDDERSTRGKLFRFGDALKKLKLTTLITSETQESITSLKRFGVEEFVTEGVIELDMESGSGGDRRTMRVRKMRGCGYRTGRVYFDIGASGIEVYPKIPINTSFMPTEFQDREAFGIDGLDLALQGGIPQGHIVLIAGNTGTGKTTLATHFIRSGLAKGDNAIWIALEEPIHQVLKTASSHGWDLRTPVDEGRLHFVNSPLIDVVPDKLLYRVIDAVVESNAKRIVIDSVSSLESASMSPESVREFMLQLAGFAKSRGITVIMNYLSGDSFGASDGQLLGSLVTNEMRLSSIVDGIILLRYVERDQGVSKLLNILKMRGSNHVKDILRFDITAEGISLGKRFGVNTD